MCVQRGKFRQPLRSNFQQKKNQQSQFFQSPTKNFQPRFPGYPMRQPGRGTVPRMQVYPNVSQVSNQQQRGTYSDTMDNKRQRVGLSASSSSYQVQHVGYDLAGDPVFQKSL